jgi:hypothetical protein
MHEEAQPPQGCLALRDLTAPAHGEELARGHASQSDPAGLDD